MALVAAPLGVPRSLDGVQRRLARVRVAIHDAERELHALQDALNEAAELAREPWCGSKAATSARPPLSPCEIRVAQLLTQGRSNHEIAGTLHVSIHTVKSQVQSILRKRGLRSRWQLVGDDHSTDEDEPSDARIHSSSDGDPAGRRVNVIEGFRE